MGPGQDGGAGGRLEVLAVEVPLGSPLSLGAELGDVPVVLTPGHFVPDRQRRLSQRSPVSVTSEYLSADPPQIYNESNHS